MQRKPGQLGLGAKAGLAITVLAVPTIGAGVASGAATSLVGQSTTSASVEQSVGGEQVVAGRFGPPWGLIVNCYNPVWAKLLKCSYRA